MRRASEAPSICSPLASLARVGFEEAAHEVHLVGVSLPTVQIRYENRSNV